MSILERWIGALAPSRPPQPAARPPRRVRRYEAAQAGRLTAGWVAGTTGPNTEVWNAHVSLRDRSRDLVRNNALAGRVMTVLPSALVGDGVRPQPRTGSAALDEALLLHWNMLGTDIDANGRFDAYGLQWQAVRAWLESGEVLLRRRWRRPDDGLLVPMQIQVLESDYLADSNLMVGQQDSRLQYGIELDAVGKRTAYALYRQHPGESTSLTASGLQYSMVPASEISHVYRADRPGQLRGVPWLASVMLDLRDLDDLEHTEIVRQKMQACLMAVRKTPSLDPVGISAQVEQETDDAARWLETMSPAMIAKLPDGEDIEFFAPQQFGGFVESVKHYQRIIAIGSNVTYEILTGDLSGVNYASIRAGDQEYRRMISALCRQVVIPHVCSPMWRWYVEAAELAGLLPPMTAHQRMAAMRPTWHPPRLVAIDRQGEIKADILEMQAGLRTVAQAAAERGQDWRETLEQLAEEKEFAAELGLTLTGFGGTSPSQSVTMPADTTDEPDVEDADTDTASDADTDTASDADTDTASDADTDTASDDAPDASDEDAA